MEKLLVKFHVLILSYDIMESHPKYGEDYEQAKQLATKIYS